LRKEIDTSKLDLDIDELFFYLEDKVTDNSDSNEIAELYESILLTNKIHRKYGKIVRKLARKLNED
jgi:hypothetical protein